MVQSEQLQASHCDEESAWTGHWFSPKGRPMVPGVDPSRRLRVTNEVAAVRRTPNQTSIRKYVNPKRRSLVDIRARADHTSEVQTKTEVET